MNDNASLITEDFETRVRRNVGRAMIVARWIMAPIYIGLLGALCLVVVKFVQKIVLALPGLLALSTEEAIFLILTLVDMSLVANLVIIVIFAGWENFVGRLFTDRPEWLSGLDFATVKLRLIGCITAIAAIQILETFVHVDESKHQDAAMQLAILLGIGFAGVLLALADWLSQRHGGK